MGLYISLYHWVYCTIYVFFHTNLPYESGMVDDWVYVIIIYISGQDVWSQGICEIHWATLMES